MRLFYISAFVTMGAFVAAGILTGKGRGGQKSGDFALGGRKSSAAGVAGVLLGALVGGASTVGTAQMAYRFGMPAIWFTLGGGIGCLLLGLRFSGPIRGSGITTISDYLEKSYGGAGGGMSLISALSSSAGTFFSVCAQLLSCVALLHGSFPIPAWLAAIISAAMILGFIVTGGLQSFSRLGAAKIILLYAVLLLCAASAAADGWTPGAILAALPARQWLNPFGRGLAVDAGALISMVVGIFTTQIYIQSLAAAKDVKAARTGALVSGLLMPPMGLLGVWIGLSVRAGGIEIPANQALTWFIMNTFQPLTAGVIWGGIAITVIGCAAGLLLGVATNISRNILPRLPLFSRRGDSASSQRAIIAALLALAALFGIFGKNTMILELSYMSMGLRGAGTFFPFVAAMLRPGLVAPKWALASSAGGLAGMFAWALASMPGDPLFAGLAVSGVCVLCGARPGAAKAD